MTTITTRYFETAKQAHAAKRDLMYTHKVSPSIIRIFETAKGLADTLQKADVLPGTAAAYAARMGSGGAVLMVRGTYKPLGVTKITRQVAHANGAVDLGDLNQDVFVKDERARRLSVLTDHPHMLMRQKDPSDSTHHMADWPIPLISRRKPYDDMAIPRHGRMANWPIPLISRRTPFTGSIFPRHARMASFPIGLISRRKPYDGFAFARHARMANWPIPLISRRKPWDGFAFPRHMRMANWPFPHLITGKTGTNALIPGGPRMANFPIGLLSRRKPYDASIFPKHARMASFPIGLISRRTPSTASLIPRHARMANMILPLVIRRAEDGGDGWSFSKMLGLPTIKRR
ncbi:MAG: PucR family transcriptional regulator [Marivita sp.]|uniref:PucR family transcriptional regulator n=1 Tax=Marivita sp. TaxID=2003365 RepID=UPI003EFA1EFF